MVTNGMLIATFILKTKILSFIEFLRNDFKIKTDRIYVYEIEENDDEYLVSFKLKNNNIDIKSKFKGATPVHVKNGCLFSINALNTLIKTTNNVTYGNLDNKDIQIDWSMYKNKLILLNHGELTIKDITKIDNKCIFLQ